MPKTRKERLAAIKELIQCRQIDQQEELVRLLLQRGFDSTQATVSRDLKFLQITKTMLSDGGFHYVLPPARSRATREAAASKVEQLPLLVENEYSWTPGVRNIERSQTLVVVRTKPGYAGSIASDIDNREVPEVMATIAGDDTILVIPRAGLSTAQVMNALLKLLTLPR